MIIFLLMLLSLLAIYIINKNRKKIANITKLIDRPDKIRKLHKKSTPLLGGIMIFSSTFLSSLYLFFFLELTQTYLIIFGCATCCLLLGLIDDIKKVPYKDKFIILTIIFYFFTSLEPNLIINKIFSSTLNKVFILNYLSIPFTIFCLLLLTNALNLIDGIDGLCILISTILILWLMITFQNINHIYIIITFSLIYIFYLNLKKNIFLGDSGSLFLGCLIGLNIIYHYNLEILKVNYSIENIFIALMLPGLDMLRVFLIRIFNKKNPFTPDRLHLHHLLRDKGLNEIYILTIFFFLISVPILLNLYINSITLYIILFYIFFYTILVYKIKKTINNN